MMGQMLLYQWSLDELEPDRELFLAVSSAVYDEHIKEAQTLFSVIVDQIGINLIVFDWQQEVILQWIRR